MESEPKGKHILALLHSPPHTHDGHTLTHGHTRSCSKDRDMSFRALEKQASSNSDLDLVPSAPVALIWIPMIHYLPLVQCKSLWIKLPHSYVPQNRVYYKNGPQKLQSLLIP